MQLNWWNLCRAGIFKLESAGKVATTGLSSSILLLLLLCRRDHRIAICTFQILDESHHILDTWHRDYISTEIANAGAYSIRTSLEYPMAEADAENSHVLIAFYCRTSSLTVSMAHLNADIRCVSRWLLSRCECVPYPPVAHIRILASGRRSAAPSRNVVDSLIAIDRSEVRKTVTFCVMTTRARAAFHSGGTIPIGHRMNYIPPTNVCLYLGGD
jgi:hypothetical protein